ncbi:MAG: hypothetical protein P4N59_07375 [Negativicutes bacterium]|nr:hypothetical protein [Negativicutes bacterium]
MALYDHIKRPSPPATFGPPPPIPVMAVPPPPPTPAFQQKSIFESFGRSYWDMYGFSPHDSNLWLELFIIADEIAGIDLVNRLVYIRQVGAWLVQDPQFGFRIEKIIDPDGVKGWSSIEQFQQEIQCLEPYGNEVMAALKELSVRYLSGMCKL